MEDVSNNGDALCISIPFPLLSKRRVSRRGLSYMQYDSREAAYPLFQYLLCVWPLLLLLIGFFLLFHSDIGAHEYFAKYREGHAGVTRIVGVFSEYGNVPFYVTYLLLGLLGLRRGNKADVRFVAAYGCALCAALAMSYILKTAVSRPRPPLEWKYFTSFSPEAYCSSFPSGHTTGALLEVTPLAQRYGRVALPLLFGLHPALMGLSRVYMGLHWPSDLLGSVAVGGVGSFVCWWIAGRIPCVSPSGGM